MNTKKLIAAVSVLIAAAAAGVVLYLNNGRGGKAQAPLELRTVTHTRKIDADDSFGKSFTRPIMFYTTHKDDARSFFVTFSLLDFAKKEITYISTYLPENVEKVARHPDKKLFRIDMKGGYTVHSALEIRPGKDFLVFVENAPFFFRVDQKKNTMKVYTGKNLPGAARDDVYSIGSTLFKDDEDPRYFYLPTVWGTWHDAKLSMYRARLDLSRITETYSGPFASNAPHTTRKFGHLLLNSEFYDRKMQLVKTGEVFGNAEDFARYVYRGLYREYCRSLGRPFSEEGFNEHHRMRDVRRIWLEPGFEKFCKAKGKNFLELCDSSDDYRFKPVPGDIFTIDVRDNSFQYYKTTYSRPAHFEVDDKRGAVYASSHNLAYFFGTQFMVSPAAIDKFLVRDGKLVKDGVFTHPSGYRFTSHRVFEYDGKPYLCTIGMPNRIFIVDAQTMQPLFYDDIEQDMLSGQRDIRDYLNSIPMDSDFLWLSPLLVSQDGTTIFAMSKTDIYLYKWTERKVVAKIPFILPMTIGPNLDLKDFKRNVAHGNFLE